MIPAVQQDFRCASTVISEEKTEDKRGRFPTVIYSHAKPLRRKEPNGVRRAADQAAMSIANGNLSDKTCNRSRDFHVTCYDFFPFASLRLCVRIKKQKI